MSSLSTTDIALIVLGSLSVVHMCLTCIQTMHPYAAALMLRIFGVKVKEPSNTKIPDDVATLADVVRNKV